VALASGKNESAFAKATAGLILAYARMGARRGGLRLACAACATRKDADPPRPVIDFRRRRRGRCFTLGGGWADGVRVGVFATPVPCASSRLFIFGGLLLRLAQPRRGGSRSITSLVASVRTLANCPPAERWRHYEAGLEVSDRFCARRLESKCWAGKVWDRTRTTLAKALNKKRR
jgi:hypothetical protein